MSSPTTTPLPTPWWRNDAVIFAALVAIAVAGIAATYAITKSYFRRLDSLSRQWFQLGEADLAAGKPKDAISAFRTALLYSRDNPQFRLRLAQALAADNDTPQAIAYFLSLWEEQPGSGTINLDLARLYARDHQPRKAAQYYNNAIYGVWSQDPVARRRQARLEYIHFLMQQNQPAQAQAEAIVLAAATPPNDIAGHLEAANLLLAIGDPQQALTEYTNLLKETPGAASLGAGKAAFQLGWFHTATVHLRAALEHGIDDPAAKSMLAQAETVLALDALQRHLTAAEAAKRVSTAYVQAGSRLQFCAAQKHEQLEAVPPTSGLQLLYSNWTKAGSQLRHLSRDPDVRDSIMDLVFRIENATVQECGQPSSGPDWALLMLSRYGEGVQR
ncbi:MAG: tetratricopeptide repeat protein [Gemmatimonadaceae bacterium]